MLQVKRCEIASQMIKDLTIAQPFACKAAREGSLAQSKALGNLSPVGFGVRHKGRDGILYGDPERTDVGKSLCERGLTILFHQLVEKRIISDDRQFRDRPVKFDHVLFRVELDTARKQLIDLLQVAGSVMEETDRRGSEPLSGKLPAKPQQHCCKQFYLVPLAMPGNSGIPQTDAACVALMQF
jgi:hypothetical protein